MRKQPSIIHDEPKIFIETMKKDGDTAADSNREDRGDILIKGLWSKDKDCILDVRVTNVDTQ